MATKTLPKDPAQLPLGERVRWARKRLGLSHDRLADKLGTSRFTIIKWEQGKHQPSNEYRRKLGEITGQPELFPEDNDEEPG